MVFCFSKAIIKCQIPKKIKSSEGGLLGNPVHTIDQQHSKEPSAMSNDGRREDRCLPVALSEYCYSQLEFNWVELYKGRAAGS